MPNATKFPANVYLLKVNNRSTRKRCEICSKLTIKTPERHDEVTGQISSQLVFTLKVLGNVCIAVVCFPGCNIYFKINLIFLIKPFFNMTEK